MIESVDSNTKVGLRLSVLFHACLLCIVLASIFYRNGSFSNALFTRLWNAWDGNTYTYLAQHGYAKDPKHAGYIVFYPLYPAILSGTDLGIRHIHLTGLLVTTVGSIVGHTAFYVFLRERAENHAQAFRILFLLFVSPITLYFTLICTEGIFIAWLGLFFLFLYRKQFFLTALCGILASSTRLLGVALVVPYVLYFFETHTLRRQWKKLLYVCFMPLGFFFYLWINWYLFSDPFYYQHILAEGWFKSMTNPILQYWNTLKGVTSFPFTRVPTYSIDVIATLLTPVVVFLYVSVQRKKSWWVGVGFTCANLLIILSQSYWLSNMRYISLILPLYVMLTELTQRSFVLYVLLCIGSATLALYSISLFSIGSWVY